MDLVGSPDMSWDAMSSVLENPPGFTYFPKKHHCDAPNLSEKDVAKIMRHLDSILAIVRRAEGFDINDAIEELLDVTWNFNDHVPEAQQKECAIDKDIKHPDIIEIELTLTNGESMVWRVGFDEARSKYYPVQLYQNGKMMIVLDERDYKNDNAKSFMSFPHIVKLIQESPDFIFKKSGARRK